MIRVNCPDWMSHADAKNELRWLIETHSTTLSTKLLKPCQDPTWTWPVKPRIKS